MIVHRIYTKTRILVSLLITFVRLEAKRSSARQSFYATKQTHQWDAPLGVPTSVDPVSFFTFDQTICILHPMKPYCGINFLYQHFLPAAYLDATELFQKPFSPAATIRGIPARYLQILFAIGLQPHPSNKDLGGLIAIRYGETI